MLPYPQLNSPSDDSQSQTDPPAPPDIPLSIGLTEFHFILLYHDRVVAVGNLNEQVTYEELLPLVCPPHEFVMGKSDCVSIQKPGEVVRGFTVDNVRKTYWVYTDSSLFELVVSNEDRDVWKVYLEKGMPDVALQYAKVWSATFLTSFMLRRQF